VTALRTESGERLGGDVFVSTIDPSVLVDTEESLNYRSMVIHGLHVEADERLFPDHVDWGYFPNHHPFTRITDYGFTPQDIPDGEYVLTVEFPCFLGDDLWSRSKSWFDETVQTFLADQGIESEVVASEVRRAPRAYPLPVREEVETFDRINGRLSAYENVVNLGRVSTYEYIWIKDIVQQAYDTVEEIAAVAQR
jgi:UDP-galactopyranose mutase